MGNESAGQRRLRRVTGGLIAGCLLVGALAVAVHDDGTGDRLEAAEEPADESTTSTTEGSDLRPATTSTTEVDVEPGPPRTDDEVGQGPTTTVADGTPTTSTTTAPATTSTTTPTTTTTTVPATTTTVAPTTTTTTLPSSFDVTTRLPNPRMNRMWPADASPPYTLGADPFRDHQVGTNRYGCVWFMDASGNVANVLWPTGWTARLRGDGQGGVRIEIRDHLGRAQATNQSAVGIIGGPVDEVPEFCAVGTVTYEVARISQHGG